MNGHHIEGQVTILPAMKVLRWQVPEDRRRGRRKAHSVFVLLLTTKQCIWTSGHNCWMIAWYLPLHLNSSEYFHCTLRNYQGSKTRSKEASGTSRFYMFQAIYYYILALVVLRTIV